MSSLISSQIAKSKNKSSLRLQIVIIIALVLLASLLTFSNFFGESRDYHAYDIFFQHVLINGCSNTQAYRFELGFQYFSCLLALAVNSPNAIYAVITAVSLFPKLCIVARIATLNSIKIAKISISFVLAVLMYMTRFFPLHELTQLRVSVGISFVLVSFVYIKRDLLLPKFYPRSLRGRDPFKQSWKYYLAHTLFLIVGISFHASLLTSIPLLIVQQFARSRKFIVLSSIILFFLLLFFCNAIAIFSFDIFAAGFLYEDGFGQEVNLLSIQKLLDWMLVLMSFILIKPKEHKLSLSLLCLFTYSLAIFYGCANIPIFAHRLSEVFQVFGILLIASMGTKKQLVFTVPFSIVYSLANIYIFTMSDYFF
ncbi:MAG: EpsG family protein [Thermosynechococcaceae cyanobacterium]